MGVNEVVLVITILKCIYQGGKTDVNGGFDSLL